MIEQVCGRLIRKEPTHVVLEAGGIGYGLNISLSTYSRLGRVGDEVSLCAHLYVREDLIQLYGFGELEERALFLQLISVSGVGPRVALAILSTLSIEDFYRAVQSGNMTLLVAVPGIGKKTAERIFLELRDKVGAGAQEEIVPGQEVVNNALSALGSLGCRPADALRAVKKAREILPSSANLEAFIREALRHI